MSFKYQFILSYIILQVFFILAIVSVTIKVMNDSTKEFTKNKLESNFIFMEELLKDPLANNDLTTISNLLKRTQNLKSINSIIIYDTNNRVLLKNYNLTNLNINELHKIKKDQKIFIDNLTFDIKVKKTYNNGLFIGTVLIVFDTNDSNLFTQKFQTNMILLVLLGIFISIFLSYIIGTRLTIKLHRLSKVAKQISDNNQVEIPYLNMKNEVGLISNALDTLYKRNYEFNKELIQINKIEELQKNKLLKLKDIKDQFLSNMNHDLRTPLNSIIGLSSIMMKNRNNNLDESSIKHLNIINSSGNDLLYMTSNIIDSSKLESGEVQLNNSNFNFYDLILEIKEKFEPKVNGKNLSLEFNYETQVTELYSDKQRVKQIILNILSNSLKFTKKGKIKILVQSNQKNYILYIEDTGVEIEKDYNKDIFDRSKQVDIKNIRISEGSALGLAISKELISLLKGNITVNSDTNICTTFTLTIPINEEGLPSEKTRTIKEYKNQDKKLKKALVLNNNPIKLLDLVLKLKKHYKVEQIQSIEEMQSIGDINSYSAVLIDIEIIENSILELKLKHFKNELYLFNCNDNKVNENLFKNATINYIQKNKEKELQI